MTTPELTKWLRENSSGDYRPAAEAADMIDRLVNVLRETVGIMDAFHLMSTMAKFSQSEKMMARVCRRSLKEMLETAMPDYDTVCRDVHEANADAMAAADAQPTTKP